MGDVDMDDEGPWDQPWDEERDVQQDSHQQASTPTNQALTAHNSIQISEPPQPVLSRMSLNDNKAGMVNLNKDKINQVIYEMSKGSKFFENEKRKEAQVNVRINAQLQRIKALDPQTIKKAEQEADHLLASIEEMRTFSHTIVHIDMDAFFAAVEMRENPSLKDVPMAVGGQSMLSTSNYEARRYGVRAAMPGFIAKKLCPQLVIVPLNFEKYREVSEQVKEILLQYDPNMCPMSLDEAYLDLTQHLEERQQFEEEQRTFSSGSALKTFGLDAVETVNEIRFRIEQKTQLTASAGIAPNMMLSKVCSDLNKPNGQYMVPFTRKDVMEFIHKLPIRKVSGIGRVSCSMLNAIGVETCHDLYVKRGILMLLYSSVSSHYFLRVCAGVGSTTVQRGGERKSMSTERTFSEMSRPVELFKKCYELCEDLSTDLKSENLMGTTVTLKIKTVNYAVRTKAHRLHIPTDETQTIYSAARDILRSEIQSATTLRLRLMGVRMSGLSKNESDKKQTTLVSMMKTKASSIDVCLPFGAVMTSPGAQGFLNFESKCMDTDSDCVNNSNVEPEPTIDTQAGESFTCDNVLCDEEANVCNASIEVDYAADSDIQIPPPSDHSPQNIPVHNTYECPVCCKTLPECTNLDSFNQHIDKCLSISADEPVEEKQRMTCPVCSLVMMSDLDAFNNHVDSCLNRGAIKEILDEQKSLPQKRSSSGLSPGPSKKSTLHKYFTPKSK